MIHRFRWYIFGFFTVVFTYVKHDRTNYTVPHKELIDSLNMITPAIAETKKDEFERETKNIFLC